MPSQLEALLQQARSALADSNSSLLNNRYPVYPGQTRPEMSALTARKRQIEDNYRLKRPSYTRAIQHATHRATGFKEGDVQSLLDRIQAQQQNLGGYGTQRIKNIFGNAYSGNLQDKINKDTLAKNAQSRVGFDNLANEARSIDTRDNTKTLQTLNALSLSKNATKEGVLGLLEQLGNQKHAYDQAKFNADRAMFNRQANYPYSRTQGLGDAISGGITIADAVRRDRMNAEQGGEFNPLSPTPSEERYAENRLGRGMNNLNTAYPVYPGKLIADLTPEMKLSYNLAERLEPNIQDNSYDERRNLRKRLTDGDITSQRALASLNEKASPLEQNLNKDVQRAIKQVTAKINASRVMSGTFGSKSHQSELDAAIRDIVSSKYGSRANITTDTLSRSLQDLSRENDVTNERVRELDRTGTREITDALNQIRNINQRGATQWGNEQNTLNQQFQQFSDEADWENNNRGNLGSNPQNRGLAIAGGIERASSQSPLVLPQALQFNNLQANIPFEESKVAAPTTDPRIQRTSQLFNDEEEMRRIAEAARERQNREELARREAELMRQREAEEAARRAAELARQQEIARQQEEYRRAQEEVRRQAQIREARVDNIYKTLWQKFVDQQHYPGSTSTSTTYQAMADWWKNELYRYTRGVLPSSSLDFITPSLIRDNPGIRFGHVKKMLLDRSPMSINNELRNILNNAVTHGGGSNAGMPLENYTKESSRNMKEILREYLNHGLNLNPGHNKMTFFERLPLSDLVEAIPEIEQYGTEYPIDIMRDTLRDREIKKALVNLNSNLFTWDNLARENPILYRRSAPNRSARLFAANSGMSHIQNVDALTDAQVREQFNPLINHSNSQAGQYNFAPIFGYDAIQRAKLTDMNGVYSPIKFTPTAYPATQDDIMERRSLPSDLKYLIKYNKNSGLNGLRIGEILNRGTEAQKLADRNNLMNILSRVGLNFNNY